MVPQLVLVELTYRKAWPHIVGRFHSAPPLIGSLCDNKVHNYYHVIIIAVQLLLAYHCVSYHLVYDIQAYIQHSVLLEQFQLCHIIF